MRLRVGDRVSHSLSSISERLRFMAEVEDEACELSNAILRYYLSHDCYRFKTGTVIKDHFSRFAGK